MQDSKEERGLYGKNTIRGETYTSVAIMERTADNKLRFVQLSQSDFKLELPGWIYSLFLPKSAKAWIGNVQEYYQKENKVSK